jgi:hypothetical protein
MKSGDRMIARDLTPARAKPARSGDPGNRVIGKTRAFFNILRAALLEIFDESAYDRFLQHTHAARSTQSYRAFMREREAATGQKPRCC